MGNENNNLGFIGAGKMANAIMKGIIGSNFLPVDSIYIYDKNQDTLKFTSKNLKVQAVETIEELLEKCPTIMIATKPFVINEILDTIQDKIRNHLIVSILAGVSTEKIEAKLGKTRIIRVMPNTPALVQEGMSAVCKGKYAYDNDAEFVLNMFSKLGRAIQTEEKYIDLITAISGSGPAFYYYIIDKIARAGAKLGLEYETSLELAAQTALGSAKMILETPESVEELIRNVTTPGGCTEVGNNILSNSKTEEVLFKTIKRTMEKAKSLG